MPLKKSTDKEEQERRIKDIRIELAFEYLLSWEMKTFHCVIEESREKAQREDKAGESFDAFVKELEKSFEEYLQTWVEVFKQYKGKAKMSHVAERIPENKWLRLQKEAINDPQVKFHQNESLSDSKEHEIARREHLKNIVRRIKGLDTI